MGRNANHYNLTRFFLPIKAAIALVKKTWRPSVIVTDQDIGRTISSQTTAAKEFKPDDNVLKVNKTEHLVHLSRNLSLMFFFQSMTKIIKRLEQAGPSLGLKIRGARSTVVGTICSPWHTTVFETKM